MGEMREPQDAEQQRNPDRAERIDAADHQAGQQIEIDEVAEGGHPVPNPNPLPPLRGKDAEA